MGMLWHDEGCYGMMKDVEMVARESDPLWCKNDFMCRSCILPRWDSLLLPVVMVMVLLRVCVNLTLANPSARVVTSGMSTNLISIYHIEAQTAGMVSGFFAPSVPCISSKKDAELLNLDAPIQIETRDGTIVPVLHGLPHYWTHCTVNPSMIVILLGLPVSGPVDFSKS